MTTKYTKNPSYDLIFVPGKGLVRDVVVEGEYSHLSALLVPYPAVADEAPAPTQLDVTSEADTREPAPLIPIQGSKAGDEKPKKPKKPKNAQRT